MKQTLVGVTKFILLVVAVTAATCAFMLGVAMLVQPDEEPRCVCAASGASK